MLQKFYRGIIDRVAKKYRVELIDDETLSQSRQFIIKPITILWVISLLLISIVVGTVTLFIYTPGLHPLIPNYENPEQVKKEREQKEEEVADMERELNVMRAYYMGVMRQFGGNDSVDLPASLSQLPSASLAESDAPNAEIPAVPAVDLGNDANIFQGDAQPAIMAGGTTSPLLSLFPPVEKAELRNSFSYARKHYGVDIVADQNTLIRSVADGFVVISEYSDENGWVLGIVSADNIVTFYKHNSRLLKQVGSYAFAGEPVAVIGNSGENSTGPHLHLEIWHHGSPVDPANYLEFHQ